MDIGKNKKQLLGTLKQTNLYAIGFHAVWALYALVSVFWVMDYLRWFKSVYFLGLGIFSILTINIYFRDIKNIKIAFFIIAFIIFINTIIGYYEVFTQNYAFLDSVLALDYSTLRYPVSWFFNPNDFATIMLLGFCICNSCMYLVKDKPFLRSLFFLESALAASLIFLARSRANIIGLGISIAFLLFLYIIKRKKQQVFYLLSLIVIVSLLLLLLSANGFYNISYAKATVNVISNESDSIRINLLKNGLQFLSSTHWFGVGAGNIEYWMTHYAKFETPVISMHNWWAEILTAYGIFIFLGYLVFYGKIFFHSN